MDTDSSYLDFTGRQLNDCIRLGMKAESEKLQTLDCDDNFAVDGSDCAKQVKKKGQEGARTLQNRLEAFENAISFLQNSFLLR